MRKNLGAKAILYPMPVLTIGTYDENGTPNAMNAAWGGISEETEISICVDDSHKTAVNAVTKKAFTVSFADKRNVVAPIMWVSFQATRSLVKLQNAAGQLKKANSLMLPFSKSFPLLLNVSL